MKVINNFLQERKSFEKKDAVKAIVKCSEDKVLIIRRQNDEGGGGTWDIPGGAIEDGENQLDALKREVFEETNLEIDNIKKESNITLKIPEVGLDSRMNIYSCMSNSLNVVLKPATWKGANGKPEHTEYAWISTKEELENLPMLDSLKTVILKYLK